MAHSRRTLLLTRDWDVDTDESGRIILTHDEYATAQNVANEARLFKDDAYFIQDQGIPHFVIDLGRRVNTSVARSYLRRAALSVPDVAEVLSIEIFGVDPKTRTLTGDIQFKTVEGKNNGSVRTYF